MTGPVPLGEPLLTPQEAARLLRLPSSTVYDLARRDVLPHVRIGRAIRFSRPDLEEFLGAQRRVV
jgi:putative molybdopterin biosynthesis protein